MRIRRDRCLAGLLLVASAVPCAAQTVHVVGAGGFPQIQTAIAAAAPGDVLEVHSGSYASFTCDKPLTIAALPGAAVFVRSPLAVPSVPTMFQLPASASARVRGLHFESLNLIQLAEVEVQSGTVAFEECQWTGALTISQCLLVQSAAVSLRDCALQVGDTAFENPAVRLIDAQFSAVDCELVGSRLLPDGFGSAGHGIDASNSALHLTRCDVRGGDTYLFACFYPSGDAVRTDRGDLTWIVDSVLTGGDSPCGTPGTALRNLGATPAFVTRTLRSAGTGPVTVQPWIGPAVDGQLVGLGSATTGIQLGAPWQVTFRAEPNEPLFVLATLDLHPQLPAFAQEATWLPAQPVFLAGVLTTDANGLAGFTTAVPNLPALDRIGLWLHAAALAGSPWRIGAPIGGVVQ